MKHSTLLTLLLAVGMNTKEGGMNMEINLRGLSTLAFWTIPAVLGLAAIYWLIFVRGAHDFGRQISQERRHNEVVGAKILPKSPIDIRFAGAKDAAIKITRAEIDGGDVWLWYQNNGQSRADYINYKWKLISPDGTVIKSGRGYASTKDGAGTLDSGEKGEVHFPIVGDPRATILDVRMSAN